MPTNNSRNKNPNSPKKPRKEGTGQNPNSYKNKPRIADDGFATPSSVSLSPSQWQLAKEVGGGNKSKGVRSLLELVEELYRLGAVSDVKDVPAVAIAAFQAYSRTYGNLPYPQNLVVLLSGLESAIAAEDWEKVAQFQQQIQDCKEYLQSWGEPTAISRENYWIA